MALMQTQGTTYTDSTKVTFHIEEHLTEVNLGTKGVLGVGVIDLRRKTDAS